MIAGAIIFIWSFIILVKGLSKLHEISGKRAFVIAFMPILIAIIVTFVFSLLAFTLLSSYFSGIIGGSGADNFGGANVQIIDGYCQGGTKSIILLRNIGTDSINLGNCLENSISGLSYTCGSVTITRTDGGEMTAGFDKNTIEPSGNAKFTDICTATGVEKTCSYRFGAGSSSIQVTCSG
jgi:hypothetical protein